MTNLTQYIEQVREEYWRKFAERFNVSQEQLFNDSADFWEAKIREREEENDSMYDNMYELLKIAQCPDRNCDNEGTTTYQISSDEREQAQCQWCFERNKAIALVKGDNK